MWNTLASCALAVIFIGGSALLVDRPCKQDTVPYRSFLPYKPDMCGMFCIPSGQCEQIMLSGMFKNIGITAGSCKDSGYSIDRNDTPALVQRILHYMNNFEDPCIGMTYMRYKKDPPTTPTTPAPTTQAPTTQAPTTPAPMTPAPTTPAPSFCGNMTSFVAQLPQYPNTCGVYCMPEGPCLDWARSGRFAYVGIRYEGGHCKDGGFTESAPLLRSSYQTKDMIKVFGEQCSGMSYHRYKKPAPTHNNDEDTNTATNTDNTDKTPTPTTPTTPPLRSALEGGWRVSRGRVGSREAPGIEEEKTRPGDRETQGDTMEGSILIGSLVAS